MSGIVGIVNLDGAPVDRQLLSHMTYSMTFRGPDAQEFWANRTIGLGHTLLRTTDESANEHQPFSFDQKTWIVADARIDGREDLVRKLAANGCDVSLKQPDVELILNAYQVWGEGCVDHLLGDFAFAIWDEAHKKLFCARDHFGVKPFFYANKPGGFVFGNTLNSLRLHPAVSEELDDLFVGEYLLHEGSRDEVSTVFRDIRRLPPGHCLSLTRKEVRLNRYWELPDPEMIRYRRSQEYIDHFNELFTQAIDDRMRTSSIAISMSGGLDSTALAAVGRDVLTERYSSHNLRAYTAVYHRFQDEEGRYAKIAAEYLKLPIEFLAADEYPPYAHLNHPELCAPEPLNEPLWLAWQKQVEVMSRHHRVALTGNDGDTVLSEWARPYFHYLFKEKRVFRLGLDLIWYAATQGALPPIGLRHWWRKFRDGMEPENTFPEWLAPSFKAWLQMPERADRAKNPVMDHPTHSYAQGIIRTTMWSQVFESYDANATLWPIEFRHPLADIRLVSFLLSLPPVPWLADKYILRQAMKGRLPEVIRRRPKCPLAGNPLDAYGSAKVQDDQRWTMTSQSLPALERYVVANWASRFSVSEADLWINLRPLCLSYWLENNYSLTPKRNTTTSELEKHDEYAIC